MIRQHLHLAVTVLGVIIASMITVPTEISFAQSRPTYEYRSVTSDFIGLANPGWEAETVKLTEAAGKEGWRMIGADWVTNGSVCSIDRSQQTCEYQGYRVYHFVRP